MSNPSNEEVLIIGEMYRLKMHKEPNLIRNRKYHLRSYPFCFGGREVCEWLVRTNEVPGCKQAIACMKLLQKHAIIHQIPHNTNSFSDDDNFYRFRIDDSTFHVAPKYNLYHQAMNIHQRLVCDYNNNVLESMRENGVVLYNCFKACSLVDWLVTSGVTIDKHAAINVCQHLLHLLIIKQVSNYSVDFLNDNTFYRFVFDCDSEASLYSLLKVHLEESTELYHIHMAANANNLYDLWRKLSEENMSISSQEYSVIDNSSSVLKPVVPREVTREELLSNETPYDWKNISIVSDALDYGFVVRGNGPCYVQTVDPDGPAAAAGLRVRMYIFSVNGKEVLDLPHADVMHEIEKMNSVELVALQHMRYSRR